MPTKFCCQDKGRIGPLDRKNNSIQTCTLTKGVGAYIESNSSLRTPDRAKEFP